MNRRTFSKSLLVGSCGLPLIAPRFGAARAASPALALGVVSRSIDINGRAATVFGITGLEGGRGLNLLAGEFVNVDLTNHLSEDTMIHWHGLTPAFEHDGVPDLPLPLLKGGEKRLYELPTGKPGTHWMHAHTLQEQNLLAAPLIVRDKESLSRDEQEIVVLLHDFSFTPAAELLAGLKSSGGMAGMDMKGMDMEGMDHSKMASGGMDINDIAFDAYLANDRTLNDPEVTRVEKGGRVRVRFINGAAATGFTIDVGTLDGTVMAVDGQDVVPFKTRQFPLTMGQRVDFLLSVPSEGGAFPILALREGAVERTGIILATAGSAVRKLADAGDAAGPILSLDSEMALVAAQPLAAKNSMPPLLVTLAGNMQDYSWGLEFHHKPTVNKGERVTVEMRNASMMSHPMHLHGHHFQIVAINGKSIAGAMRDTVLVPPMASVTFAFDAINPARAWAFHCHHLYHMATGMMTSIGYEGA